MFAAIDGRCVKRPVHDIIEFESPISLCHLKRNRPRLAAAKSVEAKRHQATTIRPRHHCHGAFPSIPSVAVVPR